jgi:putative ABC transport system substrate-binding protein
MRRRDFFMLAGASLAVSPPARAQQPAMAVIGLLNGQSAPAYAQLEAAFDRGLTDAGYVPGRNVAVEHRFAEGQRESLPALAAELVARKVNVIASVGGDSSVLAAKAATSIIPIVFSTGGDPVANGLVASLNRPGGNLTGATFMGSMLATKQLGLLRDVAPAARLIGVLVDPANPSTPAAIRDLQTATQTVGLRMFAREASTLDALDAAFAQFAEQRVEALVVTSNVFFSNARERLAALAARYAIPAIYAGRDMAIAGGLMNYGSDTRVSWRQAGVYAGRILRGEKPSDLPVVQATRFEFVINLKTARALGLNVGPGLIAIADEVIE